jgi:hypothetical protein
MEMKCQNIGLFLDLPEVRTSFFLRKYSENWLLCALLIKYSEKFNGFMFNSFYENGFDEKHDVQLRKYTIRSHNSTWGDWSIKIRTFFSQQDLISMNQIQDDFKKNLQKQRHY